MKTGIELIHREPDEEEQVRIWKNWQLMTDEQKKISDEKSKELFGVDNAAHNAFIMAGIKKKKKFQKILDKLSTYTYGILYNDGKFVSDKEEMNRRDGTDIIVQTPQMMDEHKAGMCHDASIYVDKQLTRLGIEHKCVYIASHVEPMLPTHSFVLMHNDGEDWIIIDVFASKNCIYGDQTFKDMDEAIVKRIASWIRDDNGGSPDLDVFILEHMPKGGVGFVEYSEKVAADAKYYEFDHGFARVSYDGTGIYQALKKEVGWNWKELKKRDEISWLPLPPDYNGSCESWFTMKGYKIFREKTLPLMKEYLDEKKITEEYVENLDDKKEIYSDEYQIVVKKRFDRFNRFYESVLNSVQASRDSHGQ